MKIEILELKAEGQPTTYLLTTWGEQFSRSAQCASFDSLVSQLEAALAPDASARRFSVGLGRAPGGPVTKPIHVVATSEAEARSMALRLRPDYRVIKVEEDPA
jgi:hypothetical protein